MNLKSQQGVCREAIVFEVLRGRELVLTSYRGSGLTHGETRTADLIVRSSNYRVVIICCSETAHPSMDTCCCCRLYGASTYRISFFRCEAFSGLGLKVASSIAIT